MKKILTFGITLLFIGLVVVPSATTSDIETLEVEPILFIRGIIKILEIKNNKVNAYYYRLFFWYWIPLVDWAGGRRLTFGNVTFPDKFHIIPLFANISYVFGISRGIIEFPD